MQEENLHFCHLCSGLLEVPGSIPDTDIDDFHHHSQTNFRTPAATSLGRATHLRHFSPSNWRKAKGNHSRKLFPRKKKGFTIFPNRELSDKPVSGLNYYSVKLYVTQNKLNLERRNVFLR